MEERSQSIAYYSVSPLRIFYEELFRSILMDIDNRVLLTRRNQIESAFLAGSRTIASVVKNQEISFRLMFECDNRYD